MVAVDLFSGNKKLKTARKEPKKIKRVHSFIDDKHDFRKTNLVSNDDMSDNVECSNCGLKAKRYMNGSMKFDKRISYKRIEECK